jgi:hypothetical protein
MYLTPVNYQNSISKKENSINDIDKPVYQVRAKINSDPIKFTTTKLQPAKGFGGSNLSSKLYQ